MAKINGIAKRYDELPVDYVTIFDWATGDVISNIKPNAQGSWEYQHFNNLNCGITYVSDGCEPATHGAYIFKASNDIHWNNVSLLLHLDDNYADERGLCSFSALGGTSFKAGRFGKAVNFLPPSSSSTTGLLENTDNNPVLSLGSGDFTIEFFVNPSASYKQSDQALLSLFKVANFAGWQVLLSGMKPAMYKYDNGGSTFLKSTDALNPNEWYHLAFCRKDSVTTVYVNGISIANAVDNSNYSSNGVHLSIGFQELGSSRYPFTGMLDEIRITKGISRYNGAFTPPNAPFS